MVARVDISQVPIMANTLLDSGALSLPALLDNSTLPKTGSLRKDFQYVSTSLNLLLAI